MSYLDNTNLNTYIYFYTITFLSENIVLNKEL